MLSVVIALVIAVLTSDAVFAQAGAKALFNDPKPEFAPRWPGTSPPFPVGIHYWFENARGERFAEARKAGVGVPVRLHIRPNVSGFLVVWLTDERGAVELTPPEGDFSGYHLTPTITYVVPGSFTIAPAKHRSSRMFILLARSQTEIPDALDVSDRVLSLTTSIARDGKSSTVREADTSTPGQIGTYIVHREGDQAAAELDITLIGRQ
jgi:hypothetical protein